MEYISFDPDAEVAGYSMRSLILCLNQEHIQPVLEKLGLTEIDPDEWYPLQTWLDVFNEMQAGSISTMFDFVSIGMKVIELAKIPPDVANEDYEAIVLRHNDTYHNQHRGGDIGEYRVEKVDEGHIRVAVRTPYPEDFAYGVLYGQARRFLPEDTRFVVSFDENLPRRSQGGEETIIHIEWDASGSEEAEE